MDERELVKIKSDKHQNGYYTQFKDQMKPGDVLFGKEKEVVPVKEETEKPIKKKKTR